MTGFARSKGGSRGGAADEQKIHAASLGCGSDIRRSILINQLLRLLLQRYRRRFGHRSAHRRALAPRSGGHHRR